jgi:acetyl esterase/lipase
MNDKNRSCKNLKTRSPFFCHASFCRPLLSALILAPLATLGAADDLPEPTVSWKYPPEMPGASVEVYREVNGVKLNAYIFTPPGHRASDRRPAVLFFFGGGWKGGSPGQFLPQSLYLAQRGMVAIPCDYRVLSRHGVIPQDCLRDAKAAIRWARANAARLGIDLDRIVAGGESAGGHLAAAVALVPGFEDGAHTEVSSMPNALALFNPAVVLSPVEGHPGLLSDEKIADIRARTDGRPQEISPYHFVRAGLPPSILFHGTKDEAVPFPTVELFAKAMTAAGNRCELKAYEGQPHGFFNPGRGKGEPREEATRCFHRTIRELDEFFVSLGYLQPSTKPTVLAAKKLSDFQPLVRTETWTEKWPDASGKAEARNVTAEVWTQAMQATLDAQGTLHIPARAKPYYLDGPLVLKSGQKLSADPTAEIRLKPGSNTCMVRNEHVVGFADQPVPEDTQPDTGIIIEGGIWTTLNLAKDANGNQRGHSAKQNPVPGTHGVILLHNVRGVTVRNVTVRQSKAFAIHLGNIRDFTVDGLTLDQHGRDGVHVDGPASNGIIRNVSGDSHDDPVSLTAWDWRQYNVTFGPIHHLTIEHITGAPQDKHGTDAIRLLPGVKRFSDGTTLDCPIHDITMRGIIDIRDFKLYDQPNLEVGRNNDFSASIGTLKNIVFENLTFHRPGSIQLHANTDGLTIREVKLLFAPATDYHLLELGPKSMTYKGAPGTDPSRWTEIFSPDLDCTVRNVSITGVRTKDSQADLPIEQVVKVIEQKLNPDYPKTTPKGGTGKAIWVR